MKNYNQNNLITLFVCYTVASFPFHITVTSKRISLSFYPRLLLRVYFLILLLLSSTLRSRSISTLGCLYVQNLCFPIALFSFNRFSHIAYFFSFRVCTIELSLEFVNSKIGRYSSFLCSSCSINSRHTYTHDSY